MKAMRPMVHIFEDAAYVTLGAIFVVDDGAAWGPWCPLYQPERPTYVHEVYPTARAFLI